MVRAQARRAAWTERPGWVGHAQAPYHMPHSPGPACIPTSSSGVPWVSGCRGDGIRDLQASPGGPGAVGGGSLYTSRLLLLVTSELCGHKGPTPGPREFEKRVSSTHFTPPAFPSDSRQEGLTRDCLKSHAKERSAPGIPACILSSPGTPDHSYPAQ